MTLKRLMQHLNLAFINSLFGFCTFVLWFSLIGFIIAVYAEVKAVLCKQALMNPQRQTADTQM